ncbi:MAG: AraC family transcriptional regulator [Paludibacteraceae bacterium]|nr:AraC family transcriptional regulator [Paludibacteraceae bacterium]
MTLFTDSIFLTNEVSGFEQCRQTRSTSSMTVIFCLKGHIALELGGSMVHIGENDLFVRVPSQGFQPGPYEFSEDVQFMELSVHASIYDQLMLDHMRVEPRWWQKQQFLRANPIFHLNAVSRQFCIAYFDLLVLQLEAKQTEYRQQILMSIARATTMEMLNYLDKMLQPLSEDARTSVDRSDYIFRRFTLLLHEHSNQREVQWFAEKLEITPKYLSEICRARSGRSASEWIVEITVAHIKHYLKNTTLPIHEIAALMNFPNASFFCQYTKKHTGMTPNQVRREKID